jgi:DNA-binding beta-propeller fold protein YncE
MRCVVQLRIVGFLVLLFSLAPFAAAQHYQLVKTTPLPGDGGWDYLKYDQDGHRLFISRGTHVMVVNPNDGNVLGDIPDTQGVHGIALAPELGKGFTSDGREDDVTEFDLKTLKPIKKIKTGAGPDAILYDPATQRVFTMNGHGGSSTAIDAKTGNVVSTFDLGGRPEFAVADGKGHVYANLEDKSKLVEIDSKKPAVMATWPLGKCESPSGLAMDREHRRLFSGCDNKVMAIVDADSGKVIDTQPIGEGVDACRYDPGAGVAFSSNGHDGTLTVIKEDSPSKFHVIENVTTQKGARTMALDPKTHKIYLVTAKFGPPAQGNRYPSVLPGSFVLLEVDKK